MALFVVGLGLLVFCVVKGRPYRPLLAIFALAIIMIGFPSISHLQTPAFEFDTKSAAQFARNPDDPRAIASYRAALRALDDSRATNPHSALTPQVRSNLQQTAGLAARLSKLPPASYVAVSHAQLLLGETNQARATLAAALKADPNLIQSIDPRLRFLAETTSK